VPPVLLRLGIRVPAALIGRRSRWRETDFYLLPPTLSAAHRAETETKKILQRRIRRMKRNSTGEANTSSASFRMK